MKKNVYKIILNSRIIFMLIENIGDTSAEIGRKETSHVPFL
jgi:hypothetical protein